MSPRRTEGRTLEFATLAGLEDLAADELREVLRPAGPVIRVRPGILRVNIPDLVRAERLRISGVVYLMRHFEVPRPRALLGSQHLEALVHDLCDVLEQRPRAFTGLRISAAGSSSPVLVRLAAALGEAVGLPVEPEEGDLVVRVFPEEDGWATGVRLTPRPLSARSWQVAPFPGALEATVAAAMVRLGRPSEEDVFLDACCGSGTIAIERSLAGRARAVVGVDVDGTALRSFEHNVASARTSDVMAVRGDAARLPFGAATFSFVAANPPWGHQMGTPESTRHLHPALLSDVARVTTRDGRFVLLSHQVRLTQELLAVSPFWAVEAEHRIALRGHHPRIWVLRRS